MRVVPAILTADQADYRSKLALASSFTDYVQVDFMDGIFVPSRSIGADEAAAVPMPVDYEAHLMVADPMAWAARLAGPRLKRIIFHAEAVADVKSVAEGLRRMGLAPGLALNPPTPPEKAGPAAAALDAVLIMAVNPGFYGSPFIPEVLGKAGRLKDLYPGLSLLHLDMDAGSSEVNNLNRLHFLVEGARREHAAAQG